MTLSVRRALTGLWFLVLAICIGLGFFLLELYQQSGNQQVKATETLVKQAGESTFNRYANYVANSETSSVSANKSEVIRQLNLLLSLVLVQFEGIEGGFWSPEEGFFTYAFPSYGGSGVKKDPPTTEFNSISAVTSEALKQNQPRLRHFDREHRSLIIYARPVRVLNSSATLWTMGWANTKNTGLFTEVVIVLVLLFLCSLLSGIWLTTYLYQWSKKVSALEKSINGVVVDQLPQLEMTGQKELDRVVVALNQVSQRLKESQAASAHLSRELAKADKLNALGRMVAGFAHEIRNPLAAISLGAENALDGATGKQERLLQNILQEARALEALLQKLLAVAKLNELKPDEVALNQWLQKRLEQCRPVAEKKGVALHGDAPNNTWSFDEESLNRAVHNLLLNALQNTPPGGWVRAEVSVAADHCIVAIEDSGVGVPESDREIIFEPLVSGRADGTGIGLTIVKEVVAAHGGSVRCMKGSIGARFELEIPWLKS